MRYHGEEDNDEDVPLEKNGTALISFTAFGLLLSFVGRLKNVSPAPTLRTGAFAGVNADSLFLIPGPIDRLRVDFSSLAADGTATVFCGHGDFSSFPSKSVARLTTNVSLSFRNVKDVSPRRSTGLSNDLRGGEHRPPGFTTATAAATVGVDNCCDGSRGVDSAMVPRTATGVLLL